MAVTALCQKTSPTKGALMLLFQFLLSTLTIAATTDIFTRIYVSGTVLNAWLMGACVSLTTRLCLTHRCDSFLWCRLAKSLQVHKGWVAGFRPSKTLQVTWSHSEFLLSLLSAANTLPYTCPSNINASETVEYVQWVFFLDV